MNDHEIGFLCFFATGFYLGFLFGTLGGRSVWGRNSRGL